MTNKSKGNLKETNRMHWAKILCLLCGFFMVLTWEVCNSEKWDGKTLSIETVEKGEDCERKTKKGDSVSMHYTGTLHSNGKEFDSR